MNYVAKEDIIIKRREAVARHRLQGKTLIRIIEALEAEGCINPNTGNPWSAFTIHEDLKALKAEWLESSKASTEEHKSRVLAELQLVKDLAWEGVRIPPALLNALKQERELLGLDAPVKVAPVTPDGKSSYQPVSDEDRANRIAEILEAAKKRSTTSEDDAS
jgi:hypothetical protein